MPYVAIYHPRRRCHSASPAIPLRMCAEFVPITDRHEDTKHSRRGKRVHLPLSFADFSLLLSKYIPPSFEELSLLIGAGNKQLNEYRQKHKEVQILTSEFSNNRLQIFMLFLSLPELREHRRTVQILRSSHLSLNAFRETIAEGKCKVYPRTGSEGPAGEHIYSSTL